MMRRKRAVTRSKAKALNFVRKQGGNAGTRLRPIKSFILGPQNTHWTDLEAGGVQRPSWLTPRRPNWVGKVLKYGKYAGFGGLVAGEAINLLSGNKTPQLGSRKPLPGYLDRLYTKRIEHEKTMAPIRKRMRANKRRVVRRRPFRRPKRKMRVRKRGMRRRGKRGGGVVGRAIRRSTKMRVNMNSYMKQITSAKTCDVITIKNVTLPRGNNTPVGSINDPAAPQYININVNTANLPNLQQYRGSTTSVNVQRFTQWRIDQITYKIKVLNARQLYMEPNYREPDGGGRFVTLAGPYGQVLNYQKYANNKFAIHKRLETDNLADAEVTDWDIVFNARKGSIEWISLFKPKGRMIRAGAFSDSNISVSDTSVARAKKRHGIPLGWMDFDFGNVNVGQMGIIIPGIQRFGWDGLTPNIQPVIEIEARVCCSLRANANSLDDD